MAAHKKRWAVSKIYSEPVMKLADNREAEHPGDWIFLLSSQREMYKIRGNKKIITWELRKWKGKCGTIF